MKRNSGQLAFALFYPFCILLFVGIFWFIVHQNASSCESRGGVWNTHAWMCFSKDAVR